MNRREEQGVRDNTSCLFLLKADSSLPHLRLLLIPVKKYLFLILLSNEYALGKSTFNQPQPTPIPTQPYPLRGQANAVVWIYLFCYLHQA